MKAPTETKNNKETRLGTIHKDPPVANKNIRAPSINNIVRTVKTRRVIRTAFLPPLNAEIPDEDAGAMGTLPRSREISRSYGCDSSPEPVPLCNEFTADIFSPFVKIT
ncbi:MAG: hypothetical protein RR796_04510 [Victivallaceae bacterium]